MREIAAWQEEIHLGKDVEPLADSGIHIDDWPELAKEHLKDALESPTL